MTFSFLTRRFTGQIAAVLLVIFFAGASTAATFSVATSGSNLTWQSGASQILPVVGNLPPSYGGNPALQWRPNGYPTIMGTGTNPVSLTIGSQLINQSGYNVVLPVPSLPSYVQFTTGLGAKAPQPGSSAMFFPGAKTSRPANFSWCPGATANPACTTVLTGGSQGTRPGIVKYTAGANQFGGTMTVFVDGPFTWYSVVQTLPTYKVRFNNAQGETGPVAAGAAYSNYVQENPTQGDAVHASPFPGTVPTTYGGRIITDPGPVVSTLPADGSYGWGFPFTTGMVYVKNPFYPGPYLTISATGYDNRTPAGFGNIQMVAGGLLGSPSGFFIGQIVRFTMNVPEPARVGMLASGVAFLALVGYARRRRA